MLGYDTSTYEKATIVYTKLIGSQFDVETNAKDDPADHKRDEDAPADHPQCEENQNRKDKSTQEEKSKGGVLQKPEESQKEDSIQLQRSNWWEPGESSTEDTTI